MGTPQVKLFWKASTMIARLAVFAVILGIALAQSPPPKPCPGSPACPRFRKARSALKWIWCDNKAEWQLANEEQCKAAFVDPDLEVCNNPENGPFFESFPGTAIWVWRPSTDPPFVYCAHMNFCFCKICEE